MEVSMRMELEPTLEIVFMKLKNYYFLFTCKKVSIEQEINKNYLPYCLDLVVKYGGGILCKCIM